MKGMITAVLALLCSAETGLQPTGFLLSCMSCFGRGVACVRFSLETVLFADGFGPMCLLKCTALNTSLLSDVSVSHRMKICVDCFSVYMVTQGHIVFSWTSIFRQEKMVPLLTTCSQK
jgi:hypothetical protein